MFVLLHLAQSLSHAFTTSSNVLSRYCFQCPNVTADCFLPRCVSAAGIARPIKVVNKMLPGPAVQVCQGDEIIINVSNMLNSFEATSLHWHGQKQRGTPQMDGVSMISQCAIQSYTSFQYRYRDQFLLRLN